MSNVSGVAAGSPDQGSTSIPNTSSNTAEIQPVSPLEPPPSENSHEGPTTPSQDQIKSPEVDSQTDGNQTNNNHEIKPVIISGNPVEKSVDMAQLGSIPKEEQEASESARSTENDLMNSENSNPALTQSDNSQNPLNLDELRIVNIQDQSLRSEDSTKQIIQADNTILISPEKINSTSEIKPKEQMENDVSEDKNESECSKKALELLVESSIYNEESENEEINIKTLSNQIFDILDEGRPKELNADQLKQKNGDLQCFISKLIVILKDKTELCYKLDKQNEALIQQAKSLKNVISITKDLLGIRNMEVEHLHEDMKLLEENINAERTRHDLLLKKLAESLKLNDSLKNEYHTQQGLFQCLREKYHEKIVLLTGENQRLTKLLAENKEDVNEQETIERNEGTDPLSTESVEK